MSVTGWCLRSTVGPLCIPLTTGVTTIVGRGLAGLDDKRISRQHASLSASTST
eukprot:CAMPEP_0202784114 /NCGR_PEP_ID=MMETSP1388-20130828/65735_1 /ASSEMBLY_ACC=CAM_ASM_000864 /TAXON_ID=37098 /ORGANISM="Isochrysis sp, Strain CCMP1244" /LENGTH=52 /DNA_ID=CAMNT_0049453601 /DNA_START=33 /DNA_END=188 /DNA_ORIENTATION=+